MAGQDAKLAELFYEAGPQRVCEGMTLILEQACARGELCIDQPMDAARHFFTLLKGDPHFRLLIGFAPAMDQGQLQEHVGGVVELFLRLYGRACGCWQRAGAGCRSRFAICSAAFCRGLKLLETTLTHLERLLDDLLQQNSTQQETIARLERELLQLREENDNLQLSNLEQEEQQIGRASCRERG